MLKFARYLYHNTWVGKKVVDAIFDLHHFYRSRFLDDATFLKQNFKKRFGRTLDLDNPKTLNEKINWLMLHDRTSLHTKCADKFEVRDFVKETIGDQYLIPLVFQSYNPKDVIPSNFPDFPFIIKANHDSSGGIIVKDVTAVDWKKTQKHFKNLLKKNYYYSSKEWQYKNIKPCVIAEKLLVNEAGEIPFDYKLHCFHGKVEVIQVDIDRYTNHKRNLYDTAWNLLPFTWSLWKDGEPLWNNGRDIEKPKNLDEMLQVAEKLSETFRYARIDLYDFEDKVYFGEITFHHGSGLETIYPEAWDYTLGAKINL
ncbi:teichuronopeptide biosynthesis TupA-like protein [Oceanihabitans sediminis]|uniref:Glycosyl transferase n=1 Tax=Oceanihabitans sediminis TaxID=1812012 RepID=A0A368P4P6_9FLAO|nr:ATP-grasp fold amidoligase family protein [Oceanihabitans sediminis]RBP33051.1 teichuronopeptide biosynthesis TupA-like protein [Oceanihabitans sediminis]RCU57433.1 glycosyl transferase [Oceanihabitans sediminis]